MARRVLVCGGRDYQNLNHVFDTLDTLRLESPGIACIIHGDAKGADRLAAKWAQVNRIQAQPFPANWHRDGKAAGPIRNQRMLDKGMPDLVVAFPGGSGTADMVWRARKAGIEVREVKP